MIQALGQPSWRITMLGGLQVAQGEQRTTRFPTHKIGALLAYLAFFPQRAAPRETLIEMFWPEHSPERARNNLSIALSALRTLLEPPGVPAGTVLQADRYEIRLSPNAYTTDVAEFESRLHAVGAADRPEAIPSLRQALDLYRGELLPGYYEDWALRERERLAERYIQAARRLVRLCVQQKDMASAIATAQRVIAADPLREEAHYDLMRLFVATGQLSAAQQQYRELEQVLQRELGAKPSAAARQLLREIETRLETAPKAAVSEPAPAVPAPPAAPVEAAPRAEAETPPVRPEARETLLPAFTRFIGREAEIRRVLERLREPETRLLTLTGIGGAGKTRLAAEAVQQIADSFPPGSLWFVPLADISDASHIADAIATALNLPRSAQTEPLDQVIAALPAHPCLLLLDNYEHLVAEGAMIAAQLLERAPQLKLLVTSRQLLGLTAEREFVLNPMAVPGRTRTLEQVAACESVRLFLDRAQIARPDFQVDVGNVAALAELCNRLEGLPLALELAAARIAILSPAQMLEQLRNRFALLVSRKRDVPERHRTLRATLEWSYQLLPPEAQAFLARLSVFRGGWTVEAAEAVCEDVLAMDSLAQLQECSLLYTEEKAERIRFRMLETVREFAALHLPEPEGAEWRQRHYACYREFAADASARQKETEPERWYPPIEAEIENLRAALEWIRGQPDAQEETLHLANALYPFWKLRGYYREGRQWLAAAEDESLPLTTATRARALHGAGSLALLQAAYSAAARLLEKSLPLWRELGDSEGEASSLANLGVVAARQDRIAEAQRYFEASVALRRARQDWIGMADAQVWQGTLAHRTGDLPEAQRLLTEALTLYQKYGTPQQCAVVLNNLGVLAHEMAQHEAAVSLYRQSLELHRQSGNQTEIAWNLNNLGNALREMGRADEAAACASESVALWRELENAPALALALNTLGMACCEQEEYPTAQNCFAESWAFYFRQDDSEGLAYTLTGMAEVALGQNQPERAARLLAKAQRTRETLSLPPAPSDLRDWSRAVAKTQERLPPAEFERAWQLGSAMPLSIEPPPA